MVYFQANLNPNFGEKGEKRWVLFYYPVAKSKEIIKQYNTKQAAELAAAKANR